MSNGDGDKDTDSRGEGYYDADDYSPLHYGHDANIVDRKAIAHLLERYYRVAAEGDGTAGCSLMYGYSLVAETAPQFAGRARVPKLTANSCASIMSALYRKRHNELVNGLWSLRIVRAGIYGRDGKIIIRFGSGFPHEIDVRKRGNMWKIGLLFDHKLG